MPDLTEQVRKALRDKCGCELPAGLQYDADGISSPGFYRPAIRDCPKCLSAAVARAAEAAAEAACSHCCGDSESRASVRQQAVDAFLAKLREAPDA